MDHSTMARSLWHGHGESIAAGDRLRKVVAALTRARRLQLLLDHGFGGLLAGLGLATVGVLVARLGPLPYPTVQLAGADIRFKSSTLTSSSAVAASGASRPQRFTRKGNTSPGRAGSFDLTACVASRSTSSGSP